MKRFLLFVLTILLLIPSALAVEMATENQAPIAEALELTTYRDIALAGMLIATDPEGDLFEYQIVRSPKKGQLELDSPTGLFTYTPLEGKRGRDTFTYVAIDAVGNISDETAVTIRIRRNV
ncbi:MAG: Ig-like domain-containing protein [Oscillospiraceae bacterium]|nr:Ig-like domain-containing protein [Oscillospiraceae bacterium]